MVSLRVAPLPGPAPAAKTIASQPSTASPIRPSTSSSSRFTSKGSAPSASTSGICSSLRTSPRTSWPSSLSIRTRRRAVLPCAPATSTFMHTLLFEVLSHSREPVYPRWAALTLEEDEYSKHIRTGPRHNARADLLQPLLRTELLQRTVARNDGRILNSQAQRGTYHGVSRLVVSP